MQFDAKHDIKEIITECEKDVEFMKNMKFMDYSLLLAVERIKDPIFVEEKNLNDSQELVEATNRHRFFSTCGNYVYHIAIIDYLTQFNFNKRLESFYKVSLKN